MSAYARGQELNYAGRQAEALKAFQEAVDSTPAWPEHYAGMGVIYGALKQDAKVEESYQNALKHWTGCPNASNTNAGRVLPPGDAQLRRGDRGLTKSWSGFPADDTGHANLAYAYLNVRNVSRAVEEGRKAIEIYPKNTLQRTNYAMYSMYAGDYATAIAESNTVLEANPSFEYALLDGRELAAWRRGFRGITSYVEPSCGRPALWERRWRASVVAISPCTLAGTARPFRSSQKASRRTRLRGTSGRQRPSISRWPKPTCRWEPAGRGGRRTQGCVRLREHESVLFPAALVLAETGDDGAASARNKPRLENMLQSQTRSYARLILGAVALKQKRLGDALALFRDAQKLHDSWFARLMLGRVYLEAGRFAEAQDSSRCVSSAEVRRRCVLRELSTSRYLPPVHYWLGRAQEGLGAAPAAKNSYEQFANCVRRAIPPIRWRRTPASGSRSSSHPGLPNKSRSPAGHANPSIAETYRRRRQRAREEDARARPVSTERVERRGRPLRFLERTGRRAVRIDQTAGPDVIEHKRSDHRCRADLRHRECHARDPV